MANIAVVNYCNLRCPYCFAEDMIQEEMSTINLDDFRKILMFIAKTPKNHVGIIGGEPTLHPQFREILSEVNKYCLECNTDATLFTNGIKLKEFMPYIGERIGILINCNSPEYQPAELFKEQRETLDRLHELSWFDRKANCGCNIHPGSEDYSYIWEIVDRYHLQRLRTSVVSPAACYASWRSDKEGYYNKMKPIFLKFCEDAVKHGVRLGIDCGHIPMCYFDDKERELVLSVCDNPDNGFCDPVVDITPEFKATACFGSYDPIDIRDFDDLIQLERFLLLKKNYPKAQANCTGKCAACRKSKTLQCQGGCLGFAEVK